MISLKNWFFNYFILKDNTMGDKKLILGLDVSTTTIGVALVLSENDETKILKVGNITPKINSKIKGIEKLFLEKYVFEEQVLSQYINIGITDVVIEEPLLSSNNVHTISTLLKFNGMVSESVYKTLGLVPNYISSYDSRKYGIPSLMAKREFDKKGNRLPQSKIDKSEPVLFGKFPFDLDKKVIVLEKISELFPDIEWFFDKKGEIAKCSFDSSDAICCVLGWLNKPEETEEEKKIKKENKKKKNKKAAE